MVSECRRAASGEYEGKRVGFTLEGIVYADTLMVWEDYAESLDRKGARVAAKAVRVAVLKLLKTMPLHDCLSVSN